MDKRILAVFASLIILIGIIMGIRMAMKPSCSQPVITVTPQNPEVGQEVSFTTEMGDELLWDIVGEKSAKGVVVKYIFNKPGTFKIKATAGEECVTEQELMVKAPCEIALTKPELQLPSTIYAGQLTTLRDVTSGAAEWNWKVEGKTDMGTNSMFSLTFDKPGMYVVSLSLKGKCIKGDTTLMLKVIKAPVEPKPVIIQKPVYVPPPAPAPAPQPKPKPVPSVFDPKFTENFTDISNILSGDDNNSSEDWASKVTAKCCDDAKVEIFKDGKLEREVRIDRYKKLQINNTFTVSSATVIEKGTGGCVKKIRAYVTQND